MNAVISETLDKLDTLNTCDQAITDLLCPDMDLQPRQRDNIAVLKNLLDQLRQEQTQTLREMLNNGG